MEIYVHAPERETVFAEAEADTTVAALIATHLGEEGDAWLEDANEPLDRDVTLKEAGVSERSHVHVGRCREVEVRIRYGGRDDIEEEFRPSATIAKVFDWATGDDGFELTATEKAKHALGICDTTTEADKAEHVGTFASKDCKACFDLAPKERFEG